MFSVKGNLGLQPKKNKMGTERWTSQKKHKLVTEMDQNMVN